MVHNETLRCTAGRCGTQSDNGGQKVWRDIFIEKGLMFAADDDLVLHFLEAIQIQNADYYQPAITKKSQRLDLNQ